MRAGPLSDSKIISLLNSYFVPALVSTEDVVNPKALTEDTAAYYSVFKEFEGAKKPTGMVHVYLLTADGKPLDGLGVGAATNVDAMTTFLKKNIERLGLKPGPPVIAPKPLSAPPKMPAGSIPLHLVVRGQGNGDWREFPAENWIELNNEEQKAILGSDAKVGASWNLDRELTHKLLTDLYPATEDTDTRKNRNQQENGELRCKRITGPKGVPMIRVDGKVSMMRSFYPNGKDPRPIVAYVTGFVMYDQSSGEISDFKLATQQASFGEESFDAGMQMELAK